MRSRGRARGALPALLGREWFRRDALVRARLEPKGSLRKNSGSHIHASHARQALVNGERFVCYVGFGFQSPPALLRRHRACRAARRAREGQVGAQGLRKNSGSHIDASHSRQPLVKGERLVRYEVNAVMLSAHLCSAPATNCLLAKSLPAVELAPEARCHWSIQGAPRPQKLTAP